MARKKHPLQKSNIQITLHTHRKELTHELDLHGYNVEEGLEKVDDYLDKAYLYGMNPVRLVHGHGTGKLRKAIRRHLLHNSLVTKFTPADPQYGGDGATVVFLKTNNWK